MPMNLRDLFGGKIHRSIHSVPISSDLRALVLGPHPDDFDAIGITLRVLKENGNTIDVGVVRTGSGVDDAYCSPTRFPEKVRIREEEQRMSCRFFGLPDACLTFLDLEEDDEAHPIETQENRDRLGTFILSRRPDIVFLPHGNDTNSGHKRVYSMFRKTALEAGYPLVAFLIRDPKTIGMRPDLYTPFGKEDARWKAKLLRFHDSQHQRNLNNRGYGFDDRILRVNRQIAQELSLNTEYAEAFELEFFD